jgi:AraC-like DNA-binding protein
MTYVVPNYFKENNYKNLIQIDDIYCLKYITKFKNDLVEIRTTMHSLVVLLEGKKIVHLKNENLQINTNEITLLTQNNYYMSERIINNKQYKSFVIYFNDKFVFDFIKKYNIDISSRNDLELFKLTYKDDENFDDTIKSFQNYIDTKLNTNLLKLKIQEIFLHILRVNKIQMNDFLNTILKTSKDRISFILESNIDILKSVDDMCSITNQSQAQLRRYIKNKYNKTPKVYLDEKRVQKAKILLNNTQNTISDISTSCGYSTTSWFISQFKKYTNTTPKDFRYNL